MNVSTLKCVANINGSLTIGVAAMILLTSCVTSQSSVSTIPQETRGPLEIQPKDIITNGKPRIPIKIVTTTNILKDWVENVGGNEVEVYSLVPNNADPHTFKPTPKDAKRIEESDIVFLVGQQYEQHWINKLYANVSSDSSKLIHLSEYINLRAYLNDGDNDHKHIEYDPHFWHDPITVVDAIHHISAELSLILESQQSHFASNAVTYTQKLNDLDRWIVSEVNTISEDARILITSHGNLEYFADRYGFEIIKTIIPGVSSAESLTPKDLVGVIDTIRDEKIRTIFIGPEMSNKIAESISADTGAKVLRLDTESLDTSNDGSSEYITLIRTNVSTIVNGLLDDR